MFCSLPKNGMPSNVAYQMIKDMRQLDGNPRSAILIQSLTFYTRLEGIGIRCQTQSKESRLVNLQFLRS